jgi:MYXO-CTERM domain-containing protein
MNSELTGRLDSTSTRGAHGSSFHVTRGSRAAPRRRPRHHLAARRAELPPPACGAGRRYARLGGSVTNFTGPAIPGDTVVVRWVTNGATRSEGFTIDRIEMVAGGQQPEPDAGPITSHPDAGVGVVPKDPGDAMGGCGCRAGGGGGGGGAALLITLAAAAGWLRRRPRPRS